MPMRFLVGPFLRAGRPGQLKAKDSECNKRQSSFEPVDEDFIEESGSI